MASTSSLPSFDEIQKSNFDYDSAAIDANYNQFVSEVFERKIVDKEKLQWFTRAYTDFGLTFGSDYDFYSAFNNKSSPALSNIFRYYLNSSNDIFLLELLIRDRNMSLANKIVLLTYAESVAVSSNSAVKSKHTTTKQKEVEISLLRLVLTFNETRYGRSFNVLLKQLLYGAPSASFSTTANDATAAAATTENVFVNRLISQHPLDYIALAVWCFGVDFDSALLPRYYKNFPAQGEQMPSSRTTIRFSSQLEQIFTPSRIDALANNNLFVSDAPTLRTRIINLLDYLNLLKSYVSAIDDDKKSWHETVNTKLFWQALDFNIQSDEFLEIPAVVRKILVLYLSCLKSASPSSNADITRKYIEQKMLLRIAKRTSFEWLMTNVPHFVTIIFVHASSLENVRDFVWNLDAGRPRKNLLENSLMIDFDKVTPYTSNLNSSATTVVDYIVNGKFNIMDIYKSSPQSSASNHNYNLRNKIDEGYNAASELYAAFEYWLFERVAKLSSSNQTTTKTTTPPSGRDYQNVHQIVDHLFDRLWQIPVDLINGTVLRALDAKKYALLYNVLVDFCGGILPTSTVEKFIYKCDDKLTLHKFVDLKLTSIHVSTINEAFEKCDDVYVLDKMIPYVTQLTYKTLRRLLQMSIANKSSKLVQSLYFNSIATKNAKVMDQLYGGANQFVADLKKFAAQMPLGVLLVWSSIVYNDSPKHKTGNGAAVNTNNRDKFYWFAKYVHVVKYIVDADAYALVVLNDNKQIADEWLIETTNLTLMKNRKLLPSLQNYLALLAELYLNRSKPHKIIDENGYRTILNDSIYKFYLRNNVALSSRRRTSTSPVVDLNSVALLFDMITVMPSGTFVVEELVKLGQSYADIAKFALHRNFLNIDTLNWFINVVGSGNYTDFNLPTNKVKSEKDDKEDKDDDDDEEKENMLIQLTKKFIQTNILNQSNELARKNLDENLQRLPYVFDHIMQDVASYNAVDYMILDIIAAYGVDKVLSLWGDIPNSINLRAKIYRLVCLYNAHGCVNLPVTANNVPNK